MLDIKFIRDNKDVIVAAAAKKHITFDINELISVDDKRRTLLTSIEKKRADQNSYNDKIAQAASPADRVRMISDMQMVKAEIGQIEEEYKEVMKQWQKLMLLVPNVPDMTVPDGESDKDNVEVRTWGTIPHFSFTPKSHAELLLAHDMVDLENGTKVAGFRGYFLKNDAVLLSFGLSQLVLSHFMSKGFQPMMVPSLVRRETLLGTGYLPQGEEDLYRTQDNEYLAGTGEVAGMGYYMDEVLNKSVLPLKVLAFSPCFRREAGSHGKDTKGIMRVHEFYKWEQIVLCEASHEESVKHHEEILKNSEEFLQKLNIPYHVVLNCGADLGQGQVKKYDIEAWVPSENTYRETHSASYFHDFQTRRTNTRYRDDQGVMRFAHSLNNTALAMPRILVSIIENNQQADGTILVPEILQPYVGKAVIGTPRTS